MSKSHLPKRSYHLPASGDQLNRMALAREVRHVREKTGLSQSQFAKTFHIGLARLRDFEQARSEPDLIVRVFLRMILEDPAKAQRLIKLVDDTQLSNRDHQEALP